MRRETIKKDGRIEGYEIQERSKQGGWPSLTKEELEKKVGYVTLDVPGDGRFTVLNTKENLAAFRSRVERSSGFTEEKAKKPAKPGRPGTTIPTTLSEMFEDGEYTAAHELAKASGTPFPVITITGKRFVHLGKMADIMLFPYCPMSSLC